MSDSGRFKRNCPSGMFAFISILAGAVNAIAQAEPISVDPKETAGIRFTQIRIPVDGAKEVALNNAGIRQEITRELEKFGYPSAVNVGTEKPRFMLGAMTQELNCVGNAVTNCEIAVFWELWDSKHASVVYRVLTRAIEVDIQKREETARLKVMVKKTLHSLLSRPRFVETLKKNQYETEADNESIELYGVATFLKCNPGPIKMPKNAKTVLSANTLVKSGRSTGSGVSISPDGFILTAAHLVKGTTAKVVFQDGKEYEAQLIRKNRKRDVALLKMKGTNYPCLGFRPGPAQIGEKIYVVGSPASEKLAFTVTGGIISAERKWDDDTFFQTDASINPGNSGGPFLDEAGQVLAIVSWKIVGMGIEGVGFGIPVDVALKALSVTPGAATDDVLEHQNRPTRKSAVKHVAAFEDTPDDKQPLPERVSVEPEKSDEWKRPARNITRWLGVGLFTVGTGMAVMSYVRVKIASEDDSTFDLMTYRQYRAWIGVNIAGWVLAPTGAALFFTSFFFRQSKQSTSEQTARAVVRGGFWGNSATLEVRF